jgi:hypothetical protein
MKPQQWQVWQWAALFALLIVGLAVGIWLACSREARTASRLELLGEDGR